MLNQILPANALFKNSVLQFPGHVELMEAWEEVRCDPAFFILLTDHVASENVEPAVALKYLFPEIACGIPEWWDWVSRSPIISLVEGEEPCVRSSKFGCHPYFAVADSKVYKCA